MVGSSGFYVIEIRHLTLITWFLYHICVIWHIFFTTTHQHAYNWFNHTVIHSCHHFCFMLLPFLWTLGWHHFHTMPISHVPLWSVLNISSPHKLCLGWAARWTSAISFAGSGWTCYWNIACLMESRHNLIYLIHFPC